MPSHFIRKFSLVLVFVTSLRAASADTVVRFGSNLGEFDVQLYNKITPMTVTNFLSYSSNGSYRQSIIHRSVPGFVIQGGGFSLSQNALNQVVSRNAVLNEPGISNTRGTIAMAKLGGDPNSATNQWFINLSDNSQNLDAQNGGFTVFGEVLGNGMAIVDSIAALKTYDVTSQLGGAFSNLPLKNPPLTSNNLVLFSDIKALPAGSFGMNFDFSKGQQGFVAGFADIPANYDRTLYSLVADLRARPLNTGNGTALYLSGNNRNSDLWMFWKKKLTGLSPGATYEIAMDLEMASSATAGAAGNTAYLKLGASTSEPLVVAKNGILGMNISKGNHSLSGTDAAMCGNLAKPAADTSANFALLQRTNRSVPAKGKGISDGRFVAFLGSRFRIFRKIRDLFH
jgi:cyclophilin family peptidyl-prolyl cis-trans isomerase